MQNIPSSPRFLGGLLLTCTLLLTACSGGGTPAPDKQGGQGGGPDPSPAETRMLQAVNTARATARKCQGKDFAAAPALAWNGLLGKAARAHAQDMASRNYFDHVSPDGGTMQMRVEAAGYTDWKNLGENIAAGFSDTQVPEAMTAWLASKTGHCETLMDPALKEVGFGYAPSTGGEYNAYWVQDFGSR
ncbi:CAP domain-containing protein [Deinococcus marmoris]|uniref:Transmembrane protein n=1 Tax=Deinococcus marmoris TaxID=249408 RepID=A0A1U7NRC3_9DEIO|nr:CAP domain-containing protein [Deinococcus marmoris]OLV15472.1 transmembrane protein [Deinococcus marmoris]